MRAEGAHFAGCTFQDAFAQQMRQSWPCPVKVINWGYWGSVGVVTDTFYRYRMSAAGVDSIEHGLFRGRPVFNLLAGARAEEKAAK